MKTNEEPGFDFRCPACGERLAVNDSMKAVLIEKGCVVCGSGVTTGAFDATA